MHIECPERADYNSPGQRPADNGSSKRYPSSERAYYEIWKNFIPPFQGLGNFLLIPYPRVLILD